jgi:hypothetical protein
MKKMTTQTIKRRQKKQEKKSVGVMLKRSSEIVKKT